MNFDDLELELRKLPGVRAAGFTDRDDLLLVQVQVMGDDPPANLPLTATRIAYRHSEKPVAVEIVRWRDSTVPTLAEAASPPEVPARPVVATVATSETPGGDERVRLLAVLTFPDTDELEVHLTHGGRRIIGRAVASKGTLGVVEATIDGLRAFAPSIEFTPAWARALEEPDDRETSVVACEMLASDGSRRLGVAAGASPIEAAARAALHALNRSIASALNRAGGG